MPYFPAESQVARPPYSVNAMPLSVRPSNPTCAAGTSGRELKGWQLSRCVFVGDAGMVSRANLETLTSRLKW
jgi:hypothetical protein